MPTHHSLTMSSVERGGSPSGVGVILAFMQQKERSDSEPTFGASRTVCVKERRVQNCGSLSPPAPGPLTSPPRGEYTS